MTSTVYRKTGGRMKIFHTRKQFLALFMPGFLLGIIYTNFIAGKYVAEPGIFSEYFLNQFVDIQINVQEYLWYLLRLRAVPFFVLAALSFTRVRKMAVILFLIWAGLSGGVLISSAAAELGMKGCILCVTALFPQFLFYIPAFIVMLWYCYTAPRIRWNRQKTIFAALTMSLGIITELYVNPVIVKAFLSTL